MLRDGAIRHPSAVLAAAGRRRRQRSVERNMWTAGGAGAHAASGGTLVHETRPEWLRVVPSGHARGHARSHGFGRCEGRRDGADGRASPPEVAQAGIGDDAVGEVALERFDAHHLVPGGGVGAVGGGPAGAAPTRREPGHAGGDMLHRGLALRLAEGPRDVPGQTCQALPVRLGDRAGEPRRDLDDLRGHGVAHTRRDQGRQHAVPQLVGVHTAAAVAVPVVGALAGRGLCSENPRRGRLQAAAGSRLVRCVITDCARRSKRVSRNRRLQEKGVLGARACPGPGVGEAVGCPQEVALARLGRD
mmetsp:Transcript_92052/g.264908  ORF Transcript_92052/g.264908 Transcript_92052/m.264908 type:complete len:303 (-) Transcript_92052:150-1058(-)